MGWDQRSAFEVLEGLRDLLVKAGWVEQFFHRFREPGIQRNESYGREEEPDMAQLRAQQPPRPKEKWCAWVGSFSAWHDSPEQAVMNLEKEVHAKVRTYAAAEVERARSRLRDAEDCMRRVSE